jgi:hypothetical protein
VEIDDLYRRYGESVHRRCLRLCRDPEPFPMWDLSIPGLGCDEPQAKVVSPYYLPPPHSYITCQSASMLSAQPLWGDRCDDQRSIATSGTIMVDGITSTRVGGEPRILSRLALRREWQVHPDRRLFAAVVPSPKPAT